jgi:hypothetical protein
VNRRGRSDHQAWPPTGTANAVRLALRSITRGELDGTRSPNALSARHLRPRDPAREEPAKPSVDAHRGGRCCAAGAAGGDSRRADAGNLHRTAADALRRVAAPCSPGAICARTLQYAPSGRQDPAIAERGVRELDRSSWDSETKIEVDQWFRGIRVAAYCLQIRDQLSRSVTPSRSNARC